LSLKEQKKKGETEFYSYYMA